MVWTPIATERATLRPYDCRLGALHSESPTTRPRLGKTPYLRLVIRQPAARQPNFRLAWIFRKRSRCQTEGRSLKLSSRTTCSLTCSNVLYPRCERLTIVTIIQATQDES